MSLLTYRPPAPEPGDLAPVVPAAAGLVFRGAVGKVVVTATPCDARCYYAEGPDCNCSCGGRNHGRGHGSLKNSSLFR
jgi:hypothetical protein